MTVVWMIGRRVPNHWARRATQKIAGILSFQEHMWLIISQSLNMAKKRAVTAGLIFVTTTEVEKEDLNWRIQWKKVVIQGTKEQEQEEYEDIQKFYEPMKKIMRKELDNKGDETMKQHFKTKMLSLTELSEAYSKGIESLNDDNSMSQKLLEAGILSHSKIIEDYNSREPIIKIDIG